MLQTQTVLIAIVTAHAGGSVEWQPWSDGRVDTRHVVRFNVQDYGATPDDGMNDAPSLRTALKEAQAVAATLPDSEVEVFFPAGTYDVAKPEQPEDGLTPWVILPLDRGGFTIRGEAAPDGRAGGLATIRLMDGQGEFESVLGGRIFQSDLSGLRVTDLTFDGNGGANPILNGDASLDSIYTQKRYAFRTYWGDGLAFEGCRFVDWRTVNVLVFNGTEVADVLVRGCVFEGIGDLTRIGPDWDHSTIYTDCDGARILDNTFASVGVGAFGVRTAIETHGPDQIVRGNTVRAFTAGINATGISALGSDTQIIERNEFLDVSNGIIVWAYEAPGNTPGEPVLTDCVIAHNRIVLNVDGWRDTQDPFELASTGVSLFGQSDGAIDGLTIEHNAINYTNMGDDTRAYDRNAGAIYLVPFAREDLPIRNVVIRGNRIDGAPSTGITLAGDLSGGVLIEGNALVGIGSGHDGIADGLRSALIIYGTYRDVLVTGNVIVDRAKKATDLEQLIYSFDTNLGGCVWRDNRVMTGSGDIIRTLRADGASGNGWTVE